MRFFLLGCLALSLAAALPAQDLPRRAFFGLRLLEVPDTLRQRTSLAPGEGVYIQQIIPNSTAAASDLRAGDILLSLDGQPTNDPATTVRLVATYRDQQPLRYTYLRNGRRLSAQTIIRGLPREQYADLEVSYGSVAAGHDTRLRTIVTRPRGVAGPLPALLFIQGVSCYLMDTPFDTSRSETQLLNRLAREGYVVMRVDKSGMGDSQGPPCTAIDFQTELAGYRAAYAALLQRPDVASDQGYIFGHSMGGVMAPLLARELPVRGIITYGTMGVNFLEYFAATRRTITEAMQLAPDTADAYVRREVECAALLFAAQLSREEALARNAACADVYGLLDIRDSAFWRQLYMLNIPALWHDYEGALLAAWGGSDYISARAEHQYIADIVNARQPGRARFVEIPASSHGMESAPTFAAARANPGAYNEAVGAAVVEWLQEQTAQR